MGELGFQRLTTELSWERSVERLKAAYARAMALVAWVKSLGVPVRRHPQAQAVLEQIATLNDRLQRMQRPRDASMAAAVTQLMEGRVTAAA